MGCYESHFNVSLTVRDKVTIRQCPQTTTFLKRKESRSGIEPRPRPLLLTSLTPYRWAKPAHRRGFLRPSFVGCQSCCLPHPKYHGPVYIGPCEIPSGLEMWVTPGLLWSTGAIKSCGQHASLPGHCARAARRESRAHGTPLKARILARFARRVGLAERPGKRKCCYLFMFTSVRSCHRRSSHLRLA